MLVFTKERLAFLAVPKTGSTAYHSALAARADMVVTAPPELKHANLFRYDRFKMTRPVSRTSEARPSSLNRARTARRSPISSDTRTALLSTVSSKSVWG